MSDKVYRIKPLVWEKINGEHVATAAFGDFATWLFHDQKTMKFYYTVNFYGKKHPTSIGSYDTLEAAQLAAEQWHRERMAVGLVEIQT